MKYQALDGQACNQALQALNAGKQESWLMQDSTLSKSFRFSSFRDAFAFMTVLALYAEKVNHHPDWRNCYRDVDVRLTTFVVDGLSQLDFDFAAQADTEAARLLG